jgi:histidinol-phosphate phosphatase family protein
MQPVRYPARVATDGTDVERAENESMARRAIFLDLDGVLTVSEQRPLQLTAAAGRVVRRINRCGWQAVAVSNQPGLAFGALDEETLAGSHESVRVALLEDDARLDGIYHCPHHAEATVERYRVECGCRIPATGLLDRARDEMGVDLGASYLIVDRLEALQLAHASGVTSVLLRTPRGRALESSLAPGEAAPEGVVDDLPGALDWIFTHAGSGVESARP